MKVNVYSLSHCFHSSTVTCFCSWRTNSVFTLQIDPPGIDSVPFDLIQGVRLHYVVKMLQIIINYDNNLQFGCGSSFGLKLVGVGKSVTRNALVLACSGHNFKFNLRTDAGRFKCPCPDSTPTPYLHAPPPRPLGSISGLIFDLIPFTH